MEGDYDIACSPLCGLWHYRMRALLHVVDGIAFERWLLDSR